MAQIGTHVATLIAPNSAPASGALDDRALARAAALLPNAAPPVWLAPGAAADIPFSVETRLDQREMAQRLRDRLPGLDAVVQDAASRRKRLLLADMDSTMIEQECIDELADSAGLKPRIAAITERAMRGEIAFEPALRERVALLKDLPVAVIDEVLARRITLMPGARTLLATMRGNGARTCMVSGGFTAFTDIIARRIGFDETRANRLGIAGGKITGTVQEPIFGRDGKRATLVELRGKLGLARDATIAIGDGANDIDMLVEAGLGVAFHAKPAVAAVAMARIDHGDLTALLYVQGYRQDEFIEAG